MKIHSGRFNLLILIFSMTVVGFGCGVPAHKPQQAGQDEMITRKVLAKLKEVPLRAPPQDYLRASTQMGMVHLEGVVESRFIRDMAVELAKGVDGVKGVTENIRIEEGLQGGR